MGASIYVPTQFVHRVGRRSRGDLAGIEFPLVLVLAQEKAPQGGCVNCEFKNVCNGNSLEPLLCEAGAWVRVGEEDVWV